MSINGRQRGVTLVELIVFIVIVSTAVAGVLGVMSMTTGHSADAGRRKQALMIAESLMEEVQMADFTYCDATSPELETATSAAGCTIPEAWGQTGGEPVGARPFDNVNDYVTGAGVENTSLFNVAGKVINANGTAFDAAGYSARVAIAPATLAGVGAGGVSADTAVLRITVTVSFDGDSLVLDGYRLRYAPN